MITIQTQSTINELARASLLFLEKKPLLQISVVIFNILCALLMGLLLLKLFLAGITLQEAFLSSICLFWLFARKPMTLWILAKKIKRDPAQLRPLEIIFSKNGIVWSGDGLLKGELAWKHVHYILETPKGYILPSSLTRFLWLPLSCFTSTAQINEFKNLLQETNIKTKNAKLV